MKALKRNLTGLACSVVLAGCVASPYYYPHYAPPVGTALPSNRIAVVSMLGPDVNYLSSANTAYDAVSGGASRLHIPDWAIDDYVTNTMTNNLQSKGYQVGRFSLAVPNSRISTNEWQNLVATTASQGYDTLVIVDTNAPYVPNTPSFTYPGYGFYRTNSSTSYNTSVYATVMLHMYQRGVMVPMSYGDAYATISPADTDPVSLMWRNDFNQYSTSERDILEKALHKLLDKKINMALNRMLPNYGWAYLPPVVPQQVNPLPAPAPVVPAPAPMMPTPVPVAPVASTPVQ